MTYPTMESAIVSAIGETSSSENQTQDFLLCARQQLYYSEVGEQINSQLNLTYHILLKC